jgi:hypothetical protein
MKDEPRPNARPLIETPPGTVCLAKICGKPVPGGLDLADCRLLIERYFTDIPSTFTRNASVSLTSSMIFVVGFPAP